MAKLGVLGANGFIGTRIVESFHLRGVAEVHPIVRSFAGIARLARLDIECRLADACVVEELAAALKGCEVLVYCVNSDARTLVTTATNAYEAAQKAGVKRLIYLSTASVHGQAPDPGVDETTPISENHPFPYNNAKVRSELDLLRLRREGVVELVILRPGIVFGPRSPRWTAGLADDLLRGRAWLLKGAPGVCNSIYIDNLVQAVELAMRGADIDGEAFLVGDAEEVTWSDLYRSLSGPLGIDCIPLVDRPSSFPDQGELRQSLLRRVRESSVMKEITPWIPRRVAKSLKGAVKGWRQAADGSDGNVSSPWALAPAESLPVTEEMCLLQECRYKLPIAKAGRLLSYRPLVTFEEGCRRSVEWLAFAGYPVKGGADAKKYKRGQ